MSLALKELGVNKGDVISISSENSLEFSVFASSIFCIGAIVAPLNPNYVEGKKYIKMY